MHFWERMLRPNTQSWILAGSKPASTLLGPHKHILTSCTSPTVRKQAHSIMQGTLNRHMTTSATSYGSAKLTPENAPQPYACNGTPNAPGTNRTRAPA